MIAEVIEWVPVEERMPEGLQDVLFVSMEYGSISVDQGYWDDAQKHWYAFCDEYAFCGEKVGLVTHWAEIKGPGK